MVVLVWSWHRHVGISTHLQTRLQNAILRGFSPNKIPEDSPKLELSIDPKISPISLLENIIQHDLGLDIPQGHLIVFHLVYPNQFPLNRRDFDIEGLPLVHTIILWCLSILSVPDYSRIIIYVCRGRTHCSLDSFPFLLALLFTLSSFPTLDSFIYMLQMCCLSCSVFFPVHELSAQSFVFPLWFSSDYFILLFILLTVEALWDSYKYYIALACISPAFGLSTPGQLLDSIYYLFLFLPFIVLSRGVFRLPYHLVVTSSTRAMLHSSTFLSSNFQSPGAQDFRERILASTMTFGNIFYSKWNSILTCKRHRPLQTLISCWCGGCWWGHCGTFLEFS